MSMLTGANKKMGIVSNAVMPDRIYIRKYADDGLDQYIGSYTFSYSVGFRKPDRRMLKTACDALGVSPSECVMVGDKIGKDIACAKDAGAVAIWYNEKDEENTTDTKPDFTIKSFAEMEERITI